MTPTRLTLAILLLAAPAMAEPVSIPPRQIWVVDGDTVHWQHGRLPPGCAAADHEACRPYERVRLHAIDAPETGARAQCDAERAKGDAAKRALIALVRAAKAATLERRGTDRYGRTLATLTLDGRDAAMALMAAGHALPYHPGSAAWLARHKEWCR